MADNRKYYYLKLKESYFDDDAIVLLESMPDGILYSNILLKLYLKSLKNGDVYKRQTVLCATLPTKIIKYQQRETAKTLDIFVSPLKAGS